MADKNWFSAVTDPNALANQIKNDFHNIHKWTYQWKMQVIAIFNLFSNSPVHETSIHKHLGMFLDFKLTVHEYF